MRRSQYQDSGGFGTHSSAGSPSRSLLQNASHTASGRRLILLVSAAVLFFFISYSGMLLVTRMNANTMARAQLRSIEEASLTNTAPETAKQAPEEKVEAPKAQPSVAAEKSKDKETPNAIEPSAGPRVANKTAAANGPFRQLVQSLGACGSHAEAPYMASEESLKQHTFKLQKMGSMKGLSHWFHDAKFGIFVHWGLFSVPAYAPMEFSYGKAPDPWTHYQKNPYAEWYMNTMRVPGSPTKAYHSRTYGEDFSYMDFVTLWNDAIRKWDPSEMAQTFRQSGAKYVVLVSKHHDGFTLWPSDVHNPHRKSNEARLDRDVVLELTNAVRANNMEMGLYYSGGLDWSFDFELDETTTDRQNRHRFRPKNTEGDEYADYADAHVRELMQKYRPAVLWNDITYPRGSKGRTRRYSLFSEYFNDYCPRFGIVNDRWGDQGAKSRRWPGDFRTPEYRTVNAIQTEKWEMTRGIGLSFGYNRAEEQPGVATYMSTSGLIQLLIDVVSKNGNLLLNTGPLANGTISRPQRERLLGLGSWLNIFGGAIYSSRPFQPMFRTVVTAGASAVSEARLTRHKDDRSLYVCVMDRKALFQGVPGDDDESEAVTVRIRGLVIKEPKAVVCLLHGENGLCDSFHTLVWNTVNSEETELFIYPNRISGDASWPFCLRIQDEHAQQAGNQPLTLDHLVTPLPAAVPDVANTVIETKRTEAVPAKTSENFEDQYQE